MPGAPIAIAPVGNESHFRRAQGASRAMRITRPRGGPHIALPVAVVRNLAPLPCGNVRTLRYDGNTAVLALRLRARFPACFSRLIGCSPGIYPRAIPENGAPVGTESFGDSGRARRHRHYVRRRKHLRECAWASLIRKILRQDSRAPVGRRAGGDSGYIRRDVGHTCSAGTCYNFGLNAAVRPFSGSP
jgi:hypothetical protein